MRESYRAKQSRKARINKEKQEKNIEKRNNKIYNKNENRDFKKRDSFKNKDNFKTIVNDEKEEKIYEDVVAGRNAVLELLKSDKDINKLYIERGEKHGSISEIYARANEKKVVLVEVPKQKLDMMAESRSEEHTSELQSP